MSNLKPENQLAREGHLDFLYELYLKGITLSQANLKKLHDAQYIMPDAPNEDEIKLAVDERIRHAKVNTSREWNNEADALLDVVDENIEVPETLISSELEQRRKEYKHVFQGGREITKADWKPQSVTEHTEDFVEWIKSINLLGFFNKAHYEKFALYVQQAYQWLSEPEPNFDADDDEAWLNYRLKEIEKSQENTLYFLNKYIWYKEGDAEDNTGRIKYIARANHEFLAYMHDAGYSMAIAKGRQQAVTTTLMSLDVHDVLFKPNHFMKFICEDESKTAEIFEDKLKYPYSQLPDWMRPIPKNERDNLFIIGYTKGKGTREGVNSKIQIDVPKRTAIAGGAPQRVKVDEAGNIKDLGIMIGNARPTMMWYNPKTKKLEIKRVLWYYGTGGETSKGGKAFENEFMANYNAFMNGDYSHCIIPVFFDWTCRPGASQADYDREFKVAKAKAEDTSDPKGKQHITEFHQSWPRSLADVFRTSAKTLVEEDFITERLKQIIRFKEKAGHGALQRGYFEPIYDENSPMPDGSDTPFRVMGANFVPVSDTDARAVVTILDHPRKNYINRYFQGTDPIDTDTGLSEFSSVIFDKAFKCPVCVLNWRVPDYQQVFLQSMLMNLYYSTETKEVPELIESNRGTSYYQYIKTKGRGKNVVLNYQLPAHFQNNTTINEGVGIDNKGLRNTMLVNKMFEMNKAYGDRNYFEVYWQQMSSFTCTISNTGKEVWGPMNKKYFRDDVLWATNFAYICSEDCFPNLIPSDISKQEKRIKVVNKLVRGQDGKLTMQAVKVNQHARK